MPTPPPKDYPDWRKELHWILQGIRRELERMPDEIYSWDDRGPEVTLSKMLAGSIYSEKFATENSVQQARWRAMTNPHNIGLLIRLLDELEGEEDA